MIIFYDRLTPAQKADVISGAGSIDLTAELQDAVNDADGDEVLLPAGRIRLDGTVQRVLTPSATYSQYRTGMKLIGPGSGVCVIASHVNTGYAFKLDTVPSTNEASPDRFLFQRDIVFRGLRIDGGASTGASAVYLQRCYNVLFDDCYIESFDLDGIYVDVPTNDKDSSNNVSLYRSRIFGCGRWAINVNPATGSNDLSFLTVRESSFTANGTSAVTTISGISQAADAEITTSADHGLAAGQKIYIFGLAPPPGVVTATRMDSLNYQQLVVKNVTATNKFTIENDTSAFDTYRGGGAVMPRTPPSGTIKWRGQMGHFQDSGITESQNVGIFLPDGPSGTAFRTMLTNFTIENTRGVSLLVHGGDGLIGKGMDLRVNSAAFPTGGRCYAHVLLDSSVSTVTGVELEGATIKADSGSTPFRAFEAVSAANLGDLKISGTRWQDYDYTGQTRFGGGLYGALRVRIEDQNAVQIEPSAFNRKTLTTANPSYVPQVTLYDTHSVVLGTDALGSASGTLTIQTPDQGLLPGTTSNGRRLLLSITNVSGNSLNLALGTFLEATGAPATIANGTRKVVEWMWDSSVGWVVVRPWASF